MKKNIFIALLVFSLGVLQAEKIRVACIGDSITFGSGIKNRVVDSYPSKLQKLLGDKYEVKNFGNPGRGIIKTSMRGKTKRAFFFMKEHTAALEFKPHIVVCNLGINDLMDYPKRSEQFVPDYKDLLEQYRKLETNPKIWVWTPLAPLYPGQKFYGSPVVGQINKSIEQVVKELNGEALKKNKKLSRKKRLPRVLTLDLEKPLSGMPEHFPDKIHPDAFGANVIAETVYKEVFKGKKRK